MSGDEFLALAAELSAGPTEARYRSAVSRAYYGAFHVARRLLEDAGVHLPKGEHVHKKTVYCLQDCGVPGVAQAAAELEALKNERNRADYDVDRTVCNQPIAESQVTTAQRIVATLRQFSSGPDAVDFRSKVRAQAKLLGLPVSS